MFGLFSIGEMARKLGVSVVTLRRWDRDGKLAPQTRTIGGHRRYAAPCSGSTAAALKTICYARVSCADQKDDLARQSQRLSDYAKSHGYD